MHSEVKATLSDLQSCELKIFHSEVTEISGIFVSYHYCSKNSDFDINHGNFTLLDSGWFKHEHIMLFWIGGRCAGGWLLGVLLLAKKITIRKC